MRQAIAIPIKCIMLVLLAGCTLFSGEELDQQYETEQIGDKNTEEKSVQESEKISAEMRGSQFYVQSEKDNIISIIDLPSNEVSKEIKTGERPANVVFVHELGKAFVTHRNGNSVGVIDLKEQKMIKKIKVGNDPHGIALAKNHRELYVTTVGDQYVYVIDAENEVVSRRIDLGSGARTNYPFIHGDRLYVTDHANHLVYVIENGQVIDTYEVKPADGIPNK